MRCAILADIHANLSAFEAVLQDAERRGGFEVIWCLGDMVGYGPDPGKCIQLLREQRHVCVAGNHDLAAVGKIDTSSFNPEAAAACRWTSGQLNAEDVSYLSDLPLTLKQGDFTLVHGSPREPVWEYVLSTELARLNFRHFDTRHCLVGHSHSPLFFELDQDECRLFRLPGGLSLQEQKGRLIINCGSVGQPRDGDPRASYALLDTAQAKLLHFRIDYDIEATQAKMRESGLPVRLINRLAAGW